MRYLINLPLLIAFIANARAFTVAVILKPGGGGDAGLGAAYEMLFEITITWLMLAIAIPICGGIGGFRWSRAGGFGGVLAGLGAVTAIFLMSLVALGIAMEFNTAKWAIDQVISARLAAFGLPLVLVLYAAWIVNAPAPSWAVDRAALCLVGLLCVVGLVVAVREMGREAQEAQVRAEANKHVENEKDEATRREFAKLTDADTLFAWDAYLGDNVPKDVQAEAMRRVVARPGFEAELSEALESGNTLWSREALSLVVKLPFTPSKALVTPVRDVISAIADRLTREAKDITYDGDKRIDYYESYTLRNILEVAERMAGTAGVDLGESIEAVGRAVALYPKSEAAHSFPAQAAAARKRIAQIVATGHK